MAQTTGASQDTSGPRLPFVTPVMDSTAYRELAVRIKPQKNNSNGFPETKSTKNNMPTLNLMTGFDNPRTPPAPGQVFIEPKHTRKESLQDRRIRKGGARGSTDMILRRPALTDLSPSDGDLVIGFDGAVKQLNIQTSIDHIISPITPSIVVTGIPDENKKHLNHFLKPYTDKHRYSVYSQSVHGPIHVQTVPASSTPLVPVIPHDMLDPYAASPCNSTRITSWATDMDNDEDDQSHTFVGSFPPVKDDMDMALLQRTDTFATKHGSQGWWNTITTPFLLQRSATLKRSLPSSPTAQASLNHEDKAGQTLTKENLAAMSRPDLTSEAASPHPADLKRETIGFFAEATPKTATFPGTMPVPHPYQGQLVMSPEFVDPGAFGEAAEYFEASWHDMKSTVPFYACINHDCSKGGVQQALSDEQQQALFQDSLTGHITGATKGVAAACSSPHLQPIAFKTPTIQNSNIDSPSVASHVEPSDSISQLAERSAEAEATRSMPKTPPPPLNRQETYQTTVSSGLASPEVVEATAMPIVRALSAHPTVVHEGRTGRAPTVVDVVSTVSSRRNPVPGPPSVQSFRAPYPSSETGGSSPPQMPAPSPRVPIFGHAPAPYPESVASSLDYHQVAMPSAHAPAESIVASQHDIGMARSMASPEPVATAIHYQRDRSQPPTTPEPPASTFTRNPFRRTPPALALVPDTRPDGVVSPGAMTPGMARDAEIGNAVPLQQAPAHALAPADKPTYGPTITRRGILEQYEQKHVSPDHLSENRRSPVAVSSPLASPEKNRKVNEKSVGELPPRAPRGPSKFVLLWDRFKSNRQARSPQTKEEKRKRRNCCLIFFGLFFMVLLILILVMTLTLTRHDMPAQSSWLNLTDFPPLPTGIATIARPNAVQERSGCVVPSTMWSCAVPKEQQDDIKPNAPDQPNFRIEIRFQNDTSTSNGTTVQSNSTSSRRRAVYGRDSFTTNLYTSNPAPPSDTEQIFLGNTTDNNTAPVEGEETPFFMSFLPITASSTFKIKRRDSDSNSSADPFPNITNAIPSPATNPDGTAASATLLPLPSAQPLRLYNRNQTTEHYGFYTYFDRSIFLTSAQLGNGSFSYNQVDLNGGAPEESATLRCTWAQTRFLVQIWTHKLDGGAQLLNGSAAASAVAEGNITVNSQSDFSQPGSFPYPVTITLDRHGGDAQNKMVYCYGIEEGTKVNETDKHISLEDRGFGGTLVNPAGGVFSGETNSTAGGVDGGTGGCNCMWQNWQNA